MSHGKARFVSVGDRHVTKNDLIALKAASRRQVRASGGVEACVEHSRLTRFQAFSEYGNVNQTHFMPIDVCIDLTKESGDKSIIREMTRQVGCELVELPSAPNGFADLQMAMGKGAKEFGEAIASIGNHIADGKWDASERRADITEINEAISALIVLRQMAEQGDGDE